MAVIKPEDSPAEFYCMGIDEMSETERTEYLKRLFDNPYDTAFTKYSFEHIIDCFKQEGLSEKGAISKTLFFSRMGNGPVASEKIIGIKKGFYTHSSPLLFYNKKRFDLLPKEVLMELVEHINEYLKTR